MQRPCRRATLAARGRGPQLQLPAGRPARGHVRPAGHSSSPTLLAARRSCRGCRRSTDVQAVTLSGVEQQQLQIQAQAARSPASRRDSRADHDRRPAGEPHHRRRQRHLGQPRLPRHRQAPRATTVAAFDVRLVLASPSPRAAAQPVTLGDSPTCASRRRRRRAITRTNGEPSIGISVSKSSTGNTVDIANAVADDPAGDRARTSTARPRSRPSSTSPIYIKESITSLWREGLVGRRLRGARSSGSSCAAGARR